MYLQPMHWLTSQCEMHSAQCEMHNAPALLGAEGYKSLCSSGVQQLHQRSMTCRWILVLVQQHISLEEWKTLHFI